MRLLMVATAYPAEGDIYQCAFLRPRVQAYLAAGHEVTVLNFRAREPYRFDGAEVVTEREVAQGDWNWDLVVFHAPNVRRHLRFIFRHWQRLPAVCLNFHGHEALYMNRAHPPAFNFLRGRWYGLRRFGQGLYDALKIKLLRLTIKRLQSRPSPLALLFVSETYRKEAGANLKLDQSVRSWVVHNPLGEGFLRTNHQPAQLLGDFITIRPIDKSLHGIDLVVECARQNPNHTFHVYGKGRYFELNTPPPNLKHFPGYVLNEEIPPLLNRYRGALMPARFDSHGVMMCEMAVTGMPLLASDLPVHREVLQGFGNVAFLDNDKPVFRADELLKLPGEPARDRFEPRNTTGRELRLFEEMLS